MDIDNILRQLKQERARIDNAISALERVDGRRGRRAATAQNAPVTRRRKRRLTPEGRKRLSEMMKKRWAERKKKAKAA